MDADLNMLPRDQIVARAPRSGAKEEFHKVNVLSPDSVLRTHLDGMNRDPDGQMAMIQTNCPLFCCKEIGDIGRQS